MILNGKLNYKIYFTIFFFNFLIIFCVSSRNNEECNTEINNEFAYNYSTLFNHYGLNESKFYGLPYFGYINDYVTHSFQGFADHIYPDINVTEVKCGDIIFIKTDLIRDFFTEIHPNILYPYILITHTSDEPVGLPEHMQFLNSQKIIAWFGKNAVGRHSKLKMLPIGLYPHNYSIIHEASHNIKPFKQRNLTLYLSFSSHTHPDRPVIKNYIKHAFWGQSDVLVDKGSSWEVYLSHLSNAKFIVSPPGFGLDCFRMWEAFIMGAVPIVLRSEISHLYDGLPVMFVDSWTDVKRKNLEKFEKRYVKTLTNGCPPNRPKIWLRYWIDNVMDFKLSSKLEYCKKI